MVWHGMVWKGRRQSAAYGESARHDGDKIEGGTATIATASITSNKYIHKYRYKYKYKIEGGAAIIATASITSNIYINSLTHD